MIIHTTYFCGDTPITDDNLFRAYVREPGEMERTVIVVDAEITKRLERALRRIFTADDACLDGKSLEVLFSALRDERAAIEVKPA